MKKQLSVLIFVMCSILVGCGPTNNKSVEQEQEYAIPQSEADTTYRYNAHNGKDDDYDYEVCVWVDPETGVNYLIYRDPFYHGGAGGITERLNANGTVYVSEQ